jgi:hypothetical protein
MLLPARLVFLLSAIALLSATSARDARAEASTGWNATVQLGTTAIAGNNVLPAPLALGGGFLLERGYFGVEAAVHLDAATLCDMQSASDGYCGLLWIWDVAPRFTWLPDARFSPYLAARLQLTDMRHHDLVPALGPRLGVRYRGVRAGLYFEVGPSFVSHEEGRKLGGFTAGKRSWFPQASAGISLPLW